MERADFQQWKAKDVARLVALIESERRYYQEMVAALPVPLAVVSADRAIVGANRAFHQTFGLRPEDLRRKTLDQILPSKELIEKIEEVRRTGDAQPNLILEIEGRPLRAGIVALRYWDEETEVEALVVLEDLSGLDRLRPTAAPAPARQIPAVPAIMWVSDGARFLSVDGALDLLGYSASEWLASRNLFLERIHAEDRASMEACYQRAITQGGDHNAEYRGATASGEVRWLRETLRASTREDGSRVLTGVLTDVTQRRELEAQLLRAGRVVALARLAGRLAHDVNNPLMIISGYSEELLNTLGPDDPRRGDLQEILGAAQRISSLSGQLQEYTRRHARPPRPVDLARTLTEVQLRLAGPAVAVDFIPPNVAVRVAADPEQLQEVVLALASLAPEATTLSLRCASAVISETVPGVTLAAGAYGRLIIRHNGRVLEPEQQAALFEMPLAGKEPEKSPGLPVARAYAVVREWGGDISVSGSTITLYLPAAGVEQPAPKPAPAATPTPLEPPPQTILLVEDEEGIRALMRKILVRERYLVLEAAGAEEAIRKASAHAGPIHLLLTDVILPGMGGRALADHLKTVVPGLRVLYISGFTDDPALMRREFPPGTAFLPKPFTLAALLGKVREVLASTG